MAKDKIVKNLVLESAGIIFRNFSGKEQKYNPPGKRNFCVLLDKKMAKDLDKEGWNIRYLQPREEGDEEQAYLQVAVEYRNFPPKVVLVSNNGKTVLDESTIETLDWAEIENVDLIIRPYSWEVNGKTGIKAYVKTMYVTIVEDEFAKKYGDIPEGSKIEEELADEEVPF